MRSTLRRRSLLRRLSQGAGTRESRKPLFASSIITAAFMLAVWRTECAPMIATRRRGRSSTPCNTWVAIRSGRPRFGVGPPVTDRGDHPDLRARARDRGSAPASHPTHSTKPPHAQPPPAWRGVAPADGGRNPGQPALHRPSGVEPATNLSGDPRMTLVPGVTGARKLAPSQGWAISDKPAHEALVSEADFIAAQNINAQHQPADGSSRRREMQKRLSSGDEYRSWG